MSSTTEDKIIEYLMLNMDDLQEFVNDNCDGVPDFVVYDFVVRRIEEDTGCNYLDIITYFDNRVFERMFLMGGPSAEN